MDSYSQQAGDLVQSTGFSIPISQQPVLFLRSVWAMMPDQGIVGLSADSSYLHRPSGKLMPTALNEWCYTADRDQYAFMEWASRINQRPDLIANGQGSIFWNAASRKESVRERYGARGTFDELVAVTSFFVDLDLAEHDILLRPAYESLLNFVLKPTAIVFTGGGLQAVWVLNAPWWVSDRASVLEYKEYAVAWADGVARHTHIEPDYQVQEAARMLRLPGFVNRKKKRNGAVAQLLYFEAGCTYSIEQIKATITLRPHPAPPLLPKVAPSESGTYVVGDAFIAHLIHHAPAEAGARHRTLRNIACQAARGKIPQDILTPRLRALALEWFSDEPDRAYGELDNLIQWAYERGDDPDYAFAGSRVVRPTEDGFERFIDEAVEEDSQRGRLVKLPEPPEEPEILPLEDLRRAQDAWIREKLQEKEHNIARAYLVASPPGAGKTRTMLLESIRLVRELIAQGVEVEDTKGAILFLNQFKMDWQEMYRWLREFGIDPFQIKNLFGCFIARTDESDSKGFCANFAKARAIGSRGHNVIASLCTVCPKRKECLEKGYLAQFKNLERYWIVIGRHQHGFISELAAYRKLINVDESVFDLIGRSIVLNLEDLTPHSVVDFVVDQYLDEALLVTDFLTTIQGILLKNKNQIVEDQQRSNVQYHGFWFMDHLVRAFGAERLLKVFQVPAKVLRGLNGIDSSTLDSILESQPHYLQHLIAILEYEYRTHYSAGAKQWNSRLIPYNTDLYIHPMEPFSFSANTKLFVLDATGLPPYYPLAFADQHTESIRDSEGAVTGRLKAPRPRQLEVFDTQLVPRSHVTVFYGSENTKNTVFRNYHPEQLRAICDQFFATRPPSKYTIADTLKLAELIRKNGNPALAQIMIVAHELILRHKGNILIVAYKGLIGGSSDPEELVKEDESTGILMHWLKKARILPLHNVQWFYNLRGRNEWRNCEAIFLIGTPRIPEIELLISAQIWHWRDPLPIELERQWRTWPYIQYRDGDGNAIGYQCWGYRDDRVNRLYGHYIGSEMWQCIGRIRPNTSDGERHIYIASPFPCTDHVDEFRPWDNAHLHLIANQILEKYRHRPNSLKEDLIQEIAGQATCATITARRALAYEYENGISYEDYRPWREIMREGFFSQHKQTKLEMIYLWLRDHQDVWHSINTAREAYYEAHPDEKRCSRELFAKAIRLLEERGELLGLTKQ
jgi:hypothetical protein